MKQTGKLDQRSELFCSGSIPEIKAEETTACITSDSGTCLLLTTIFALVCPAPSLQRPVWVVLVRAPSTAA